MLPRPEERNYEKPEAGCRGTWVTRQPKDRKVAGPAGDLGKENWMSWSHGYAVEVSLRPKMAERGSHKVNPPDGDATCREDLFKLTPVDCVP